MNKSMNNSEILIKTKSSINRFKEEIANNLQKDPKNLMISNKKIQTNFKTKNSKIKIIRKVKFSTNLLKRKLTIPLNSLKIPSSTT